MSIASDRVLLEECCIGKLKRLTLTMLLIAGWRSSCIALCGRHAHHHNEQVEGPANGEAVPDTIQLAGNLKHLPMVAVRIAAVDSREHVS